MNQTTLIAFLLALIPIIWLLFGLGKLKMPAYRASIVALVMTIAIAGIFFHMPASAVAEASLEGTMLALFPILWVILSALFVYNTTVETGNMEKMKSMLSGLSPDRRIQGLVLAFAFGGFLEAVAGFGTAVAIPAAILVAMGFSPFLAAVLCLVANTVPVGFGVLGVPVITLAQVTSLPLSTLSAYTALQLFPLAVFLPLFLVFLITGSVKGVKGVVGISIFAGSIFAAGQTLIAFYIGPELAAMAGSLLSLVSIVLYAKILPVKKVWLFDGEQRIEGPVRYEISRTDSLKAWAPYALVLLLVLGVNFIPFLHFLKSPPFVISQQFYFGPGGKPMAFPLVTSPGSILFLSAVFGGLIQGASLRRLGKVLIKTCKQVKLTFVTVIAIVALAKVMGYSGMVDAISNALAIVSGGFYPLLAPCLGAIGTFITGSDTSSNVLLGNLQNQTALRLDMNPEWLSAANASGATAGKMISPQSISIVASATGLTNKEGKLLSQTFKYCVVYVVILGALVFFLQPR